ncbi:MAG: hypothetical protein AAF541_14485 [Pseudomonadota bacterium]
MIKVLLRLVGAGLLLLAVPLHAAEQPKPAFMQPEVLKAAIDINMTEEQKPQFQQALTTFVEDRMKMIGKLMRGNNVTNMPRKIKSRTNTLLKKMDKNMAKFLTEEQMPAYENYRNLLKDNLRGGA